MQSLLGFCSDCWAKAVARECNGGQEFCYYLVEERSCTFPLPTSFSYLVMSRWTNSKYTGQVCRHAHYARPVRARVGQWRAKAHYEGHARRRGGHVITPSNADWASPSLGILSICLEYIYCREVGWKLYDCMSFSSFFFFFLSLLDFLYDKSLGLLLIGEFGIVFNFGIYS